ncbi:WxPxxD family membrane protein [Siminovitchia terrae]|uniref:WxPxxD family membrane protein n=1 Tax=Siminovitchia terrae TaxID=1914933 RepID=UPI001BB3DDFD
MNYNYLKFLCIIPFFIFLWLSLNWNNIDSGINHSNLLNLTTSYAGYNFLMLHGTIYALLYLLLLMSNYSHKFDQLIIRIRRKDIIKKMFLKVIYLSILFVGIFTIINVLMISVFSDTSLLIQTGFYLGAFISFISTVFLYSMLGLVFSTFYIITFSETKSLILTFISSTLFVCCDLILGWDTPFSDIVVFDNLFSSSGFNLLKYMFIYFKDLFILACFYFGLVIIFKEKDIIHV